MTVERMRGAVRGDDAFCRHPRASGDPVALRGAHLDPGSALRAVRGDIKSKERAVRDDVIKKERAIRGDVKRSARWL
jgi:hypothetical protein